MLSNPVSSLHFLNPLALDFWYIVRKQPKFDLVRLRRIEWRNSFIRSY